MLSQIEKWILKRTGLTSFADLAQWQEEALLKQRELAKKSAYYKTDREFSYPEDLAQDPYAFLCLNPKEISRITTLPTSGTGGSPKRIFFSEADLELTAEYFCVGMQELIEEKDFAAIFMPGSTPGSVGELLQRGIKRFNASAQSYGFIEDLEKAAKQAKGAQCLLGHPTQLLSLSRYAPELRPKSILLTGDPTPSWLLNELEQTWKTRTHPHYGSTEAGFGCAVRGRDGQGLQICHPFTLIEIIDRKTGENLPDGEWGEIVLSTLQRQAMPFLRYRTGDIGRYLPGFNPKRLDVLVQRIKTPKCFDGLDIHQLDQMVFSIREVLTYRASLNKQGLHLEIYTSLNEAQLKKRLKEVLPDNIPYTFALKTLNLDKGKRRIHLEI